MKELRSQRDLKWGAEMQRHKYKDTNTKTQIQRLRYKDTNTKTDKQRHNYKYGKHGVRGKGSEAESENVKKKLGKG